MSVSFSNQSWLFLCLVSIVVFPTITCLGQVQLKNPFLEGPSSDGVPPSGWSTCNESSTPDTQPGQYDVFNLPSQGKSYVGMVTRENGTYEAIGQGFSLQKGSCYFFSLDLSRSDKYWGYTTPVILRIWGGTTLCGKQELLWSSTKIEHYTWKTYPVQLSPQSNYSYLLLEAYYEKLPAYRGNLLLDNISPITVVSLPALELGKDTTLCDGEQLLLSVDNAAPSIRWQDGSTSSTFLVEKEGTYRVTTSNSCSQLADQIKVTYQECPDKFTIPNVFTPNGDTYNETFQIRNLHRDGWRMSIFNRWGKLVYQQDNYHGEWAAEGMLTGIYFYQFSKAGFPMYKGWVQVLR